VTIKPDFDGRLHNKLGMLYRIHSSLVIIDPATLYRCFDFRIRGARLIPRSEKLFCASASSLETYWHCLSCSRQLQSQLQLFPELRTQNNVFIQQGK
jgi:hypothetical protein